MPARNARAPRALVPRRTISTEVDQIDVSLNDALRETRSIEALINNQSRVPVQTVDAETHAATDNEYAAYKYQEFQRQSTFAKGNTRYAGFGLTVRF